MLSPTVFAVLLTVIPLLILRAVSLLPGANPRPRPSSRQPGTSTRILIVLGSGGHTAEMLSLLRGLPTTKYTHRSYVVSSGDALSAAKARAFEADLMVMNIPADASSIEQKQAAYGKYDVAVVPRARYIHQSILTTPWTALQCLFACFSVLQGQWRPSSATRSPGDGRKGVRDGTLPASWPDVIVMNGPGTAVVVVVASLLVRFVGFWGDRDCGRMRTIYVESWARVRSLSLSGKLLLRIVDRFIVQWDSLKPATGRKGEYRGVLV